MRITTVVLIGVLCTSCIAGSLDGGFLVAPLDRLASFERTDSPGILDILLQPDFSVPDHLRPCCAFGYDLDVSVASLPIAPTQPRAEDNIHETLVVEFAPTSVVRTFAHERYRGKRRQ